MHRIEADHRLINHEHFRIVQQRAADHEPLPRAVAEIFRQLVAVVVEVEAIEERLHPLLDDARLHPEDVADELHEFDRGELVVSVGKVGHVGETRLGFLGIFLNIESCDRCAAGARLQQAGEHLDRGGLARAVRPEECEELALRDIEVE